MLSLLTTKVDKDATDDGDTGNELSKDALNVLSSDITTDSIVANRELVLTLLLPTVDDGTSNEGDTNSDLSEDSLTVLCSDDRLDRRERLDRLEGTIEDDDLWLSLLTLKLGENATDEGDPNIDLSDKTSTVIFSEVSLDTTMEDGDTLIALLT